MVLYADNVEESCLFPENTKAKIKTLLKLNCLGGKNKVDETSTQLLHAKISNSGT